nr:uncharacterized protein LOC107438089 [Parasteatoda tepidariorum]
MEKDEVIDYYLQFTLEELESWYHPYCRLRRGLDWRTNPIYVYLDAGAIGMINAMEKKQKEEKDRKNETAIANPVPNAQKTDEKDATKDPVPTPTIEMDTTEIPDPPEKRNKKKRKKAKTSVNQATLPDITAVSEPTQVPAPAIPADTIPTESMETADSEDPSPTLDIAPKPKLKTLIRGLLADTDISALEKYLIEFGIHPEKIIQLSKRSGQELRPLPLFLIIQMDTPTSRKIYNISSILERDVIVERFRGGRFQTQCFRCQKYGHTQRNCQVTEPACMECAEAHLTYLCTKPISTPAKGINCDGEHPACFSDCGARPRKPTHRRRAQPKTTKDAASRFLLLFKEMKELLQNEELVKLLRSLLPEPQN